MKLEFSTIKGLEKLGSGQYGEVFKAPPGSLDPSQIRPQVVKKYRKKHIQGNEQAMDRHLRSLIAARNNGSSDLQKVIDKHTIWPKVVVYENDQACGFVMDLIPSNFFFRGRFGTIERVVETKFESVLDSNAHREKIGLPAITAPAMAKITHELLRITAELHQGRIVVGDISPNNILINIPRHDQINSEVLLIDSDSFRIVHSTHPLKQPHTPSWVPPEALAAAHKRAALEQIPESDPFEISRLGTIENIQNTETDVYKICLAIMRLFHNEQYRCSIPVSPVAKARLTQLFGPSFANLVYEGLSEMPALRPTAQQLLTTLRQSS